MTLLDFGEIQGPMTFAKGATPELGDMYEAALEATRLTDNASSKERARIRAYDRRIAVAEEVTGVKLENPANILQNNILIDKSVSDEFNKITAEKEQKFETLFNELVAQHPDNPKLKFNTTPNQEALLLMKAADHNLNNASNRRSGIATGIAKFLGAAQGTMEDPINIASMLFGGGGATAARRILISGFANAFSEAITQPQVQQNRKEAALPNGMDQALMNIGMGFVGGAGLQGIGEGVSAAFKAGRKAISPADIESHINTLPENSPIRQAFNGDPDAAEKLLKHLQLDKDPELRGAVQAMRNHQEIKTAKPEGVHISEHERMLQDTLIADMPNMPSAAYSTPSPAKREAIDLLDHSPAPVSVGRSFEYHGKPIQFESLNALELKTNAELFQYKGRADNRGVTDRLSGITKWDNLSTGKVVVFEAKDGTRTIADGHQRTGLANRLVEQGYAKPNETILDAYVLREADGWTPKEVRGLAAAKKHS